MADRFHSFSVELAGGKRINGVWALKQGNRLCVSWGEHVEHVELKPGERPEQRAGVVLVRIVKKHLGQLEKERRAFEAKRRRLSPES